MISKVLWMSRAEIKRRERQAQVRCHVDKLCRTSVLDWVKSFDSAQTATAQYWKPTKCWMMQLLCPWRKINENWSLIGKTNRSGVAPESSNFLEASRPVTGWWDTQNSWEKRWTSFFLKLFSVKKENAWQHNILVNLPWSRYLAFLHVAWLNFTAWMLASWSLCRSSLFTFDIGWFATCGG